MSVFLVAILSFACALPVWTAHLYGDLYRHERAQILIDNTAIQAGRAFREAMREMSELKSWLERWEKAHHPTHHCARASENCAVTDLAMEAAAEGRVALALASLSLKWQQGWRFLAEGRVGAATRATPTAPWQRTACEICGGQWEVGWQPEAFPQWIELTAPENGSLSVFLCLGSDDEYRLFSEKEWGQRHCR